MWAVSATPEHDSREGWARRREQQSNCRFRRCDEQFFSNLLGKTQTKTLFVTLRETVAVELVILGAVLFDLEGTK